MKFVTNVRHDGKDYPKGSNCPKELIEKMKAQGLVSGSGKTAKEEKAAEKPPVTEARIETAHAIEGEAAEPPQE